MNASCSGDWRIISRREKLSRLLEYSRILLSVSLWQLGRLLNLSVHQTHILTEKTPSTAAHTQILPPQKHNYQTSPVSTLTSRHINTRHKDPRQLLTRVTFGWFQSITGENGDKVWSHGLEHKKTKPKRCMRGRRLQPYLLCAPLRRCAGSPRFNYSPNSALQTGSEHSATISQRFPLTSGNLVSSCTIYTWWAVSNGIIKQKRFRRWR